MSAPNITDLASTPQDLSVFCRVSVWIFDLDNTLYPRHSMLFEQIDKRMGEYVSKLLGVSDDKATTIQRQLYKDYGSTLNGLMETEDISVDEFLEYVHDIDHSAVDPDPILGSAIANLPGRKFIFTNGSRAHAERVAERLGITEHFEDIFDIVSANLVPKPARETYDRFVGRFNVAPQQAAMFEDLARNLVVPQSIGMQTVLVVPQGTREIVAPEWEREGHDGSVNVDFITDDISRFVTDIVTTITDQSPRRKQKKGSARGSKTSLALRRARPEDLSDLNHLSFASKESNGYDKGFMEACRAELTLTPDRLDEWTVNLIEDNGGTIIGHYALSLEEKLATVELFFVAPDNQRSGIGRALWLALKSDAQRLGAVAIEIESDPYSEPFYEAMGASKVGAVPSRSIKGRELPVLRFDL